MIVQVTMTRDELFIIKEMLPLWQKYADAFVFMDDNSVDGTYEFLLENKEKYNILSVIKSGNREDKLTIESDVRQRLFDEAFKYSNNIICMDTDEYLDGTLTKDDVKNILATYPDTLFHLQWIQYTDINQIRVDGPWRHNLKDRLATYSTRALYKPMQMHAEHLPVPKNQLFISVPHLFIAHIQWLDKPTVAVKQYFYKICDYVTRNVFNAETVPASAYDVSVNNFNWEYQHFDIPLKVNSKIYDNHDLKNSHKYNFIRNNIKKYNIPNLNDWGMNIHE